jgi:hypothetical protein
MRVELTRVLAVMGLLVLLLVPAGVFAAPSTPKAVTQTTVLSIYQSPSRVTEQDTFSVFLEVASTANIARIWFSYCQLTGSICYRPVAMSPHGGNWYEGTTARMSQYPGMNIGVEGGYNITVVYTDASTVHYPRLPSPFANLTVATAINGSYDFSMIVSDHVYALSGHVQDAITGAAVSGATVTLTPNDAPAVTTNATGAYAFAELLNGTYTVSAARAGYRTNNVTVSVAGQAATRDVGLSNASTPVGPHSAGSKGPLGFFTTPVGLGAIAVVAIVVVLVSALAYSMSRKRKAAGPATTPGPSDSSAPPTKSE